MADCVRCERPVHDTGYACQPCTDSLGELLGTVAQLAEEAVITIAKLARHGDRSGHGGGVEPPLLFDTGAADKAWAAHNTIVTWAREVSASRGIPFPPRPRRPGTHPTGRAATWLVGQLGWLRMQPQAGEAVDELCDAVHTLRSVVDNPVARWYAGPCGSGCDAELYALPNAGVVRCRECGAEHDANQRRAWLLDQVRDQLLHAAWMASALSALGATLPVSTVYNWAARGRLAQHGADALGRPLYRVGDALDLLDA